MQRKDKIFVSIGVFLIKSVIHSQLIILRERCHQNFEKFIFHLNFSKLIRINLVFNELYDINVISGESGAAGYGCVLALKKISKPLDIIKQSTSR